MNLLDSVIILLEGENPPDISGMKPQPAKRKEESNTFKTQEIKPMDHDDIEVQRSYINMKSVPAYPTLSKVLGKEVK